MLDERSAKGKAVGDRAKEVVASVAQQEQLREQMLDDNLKAADQRREVISRARARVCVCVCVCVCVSERERERERGLDHNTHAN